LAGPWDVRPNPRKHKRVVHAWPMLSIVCYVDKPAGLRFKAILVRQRTEPTTDAWQRGAAPVGTDTSVLTGIGLVAGLAASACIMVSFSEFFFSFFFLPHLLLLPCFSSICPICLMHAVFSKESNAVTYVTLLLAINERTDYTACVEYERLTLLPFLG
jgi:hypothetical protein